MKLSSLVRRLGAFLAAGVLSLSSHAAVTTQLGFLVDASGSIGTGNFSLMRAGYAAALNALPTDGSIEVTLFTFSTGTTQVIAPTVLTAATLPGMIAAVNSMVYSAGVTATNLGIDAISAAMVGSGNFDAGLRSIINMATDGQPNTSGLGSGASQAAAEASALAARNRGIDALTAEAIGSFNSAGLLDMVFSPLTTPGQVGGGVLLANGATPPNPMTSTPWVLPVNSFDDFQTAIVAKVQAITQTVPEPGSLALAALALAGMGLSRRRSTQAS